MKLCVDCGKETHGKRCPPCRVEFIRTPAQRQLTAEKTRQRMADPAIRQNFLIGIKNRKKPFQDGPSNPNWQGGKTQEALGERRAKEYRRWRKAVLERDGYTCQQCGSKTELHVHHVEPFASAPEKRFDVNNGLTLCQECHSSVHGHPIRPRIPAYKPTYDHCPVCDALKLVPSKTCRSCCQLERITRKCQVCGKRTRDKIKRCRSCIRAANKPMPKCPGCDKPLADSRSKYCHNCLPRTSSGRFVTLPSGRRQRKVPIKKKVDQDVLNQGLNQLNLFD